MLLDRPVAGGLTLYPPRAMTPAGRPAEEFYLLRADAELDRAIDIRVAEPDGSLRRTWLAEYVAAQMNGLLRLAPGWDGHRARAIADDAVSSAANLILAVADDLTIPPQLFPLVDGGIQFEWHAGPDTVEIEIDPAGRAYGFVSGPDGSALDDAINDHDEGELAVVRDAVRRLSSRAAGADASTS